MQVVFFRHAKAEEHGLKPDADRALVEKGRKQVQNAAHHCRDVGLVPDLILSSPLRRATETANILANNLKIASPVIVPWLAIGRAGREAIDELDAFADYPCVFLVGHEPDFSSVIARMLGISDGNIHVGKASLIGLRCQRPSPGRAVLEFHFPNSMLGKTSSR